MQQESNKLFEESIDKNSYLGDSEFQTKFTYRLDDRGMETERTGLKCLNELIPITLLFNEQIDTVIIIENGKTTTFSIRLIKEHKKMLINEYRIDTIEEDKIATSINAYLYKNEQYETCIITQNKNKVENIFQLTPEHSRLFYTFPLIGTEEIGIPIIINSTNFGPKVERDGIYLKTLGDEKTEKNKEIIQGALLNSLQLFAELFKEKDVNGIYELFNFNCDKEFGWIDEYWFTSLKKEAINLLASKEIIKYNSSGNNYVCLDKFKVPLAIKEKNIKELWELLSEITDIRIPLEDELFDWLNIAKNISKIKNEDILNLVYVYDINKLIGFVKGKESFAELNKAVRINGYDWLNNLYSLIVKEKENFPLEENIALNQRDRFINANNISWDKCNDMDLNSISDLAELNFADKLFSEKINYIHITGVENFEQDEAVNNLLIKINSFTEDDINDNPSYRECNAKFLKWLISKNNKEKIKDLKIMSEDDESFTYDHFPIKEPLLLTPMAYFMKEFPLFAGLIRSEDCLSDFYNDFLVENDYIFLSDNGLIYLKPLIVKKAKATKKLLKDLIINEEDLGLLIDNDGQLKEEFKIEYSDFAYLTTNDGHIYHRNTTQKSSLERLKFFLIEAVEKDSLLDKDEQNISIEGIEKPIKLGQCLWIYRAKGLNWIHIKNEDSDKPIRETPSSKNLSGLLKGDDALIRAIHGEKQQRFLKKLGVGVSDLIINTSLSDEEKDNWDKAITNMITSKADPKLVMEIFSDPIIKKVYEKRIKDKELINRNQIIGKLIEDLFKEYIEQIREDGTPVDIKREPFGSDYILTEESSDLVNDDKYEMFKINNWLVELKATGKEYAAMTPLQAKTAKEKKETYALIVVPLDGTEPDIEYLKKNARVVADIGSKIDNAYKDFNEVEIKRNNLKSEKDGITVNIEDQNIQFRISSSIWNDRQQSIEEFIAENFRTSRKD